MSRRFPLALLGLLLAQATACASEVATVVAGRNTEATPTLDRNGTFGSSSVSQALDTVSVDLTALAKHRSFDVWVSLSDDNAATDYTFTINLTNSVGLAPVSPSQNAAVGDDIGPIDVEIIPFSTSVGAGGITTDVAATFDSAGSSTTPNVALGNFVNGGSGTSTHIRIGGLNGGGYAIPHGDVGTFSFIVSIPDFIPGGFTGGGAFAIRFTANPEPGTILLVSIVLASFAGMWFHQRRRAAGGTLAETAA